MFELGTSQPFLVPEHSYRSGNSLRCQDESQGPWNWWRAYREGICSSTLVPWRKCFQDPLVQYAQYLPYSQDNPYHPLVSSSVASRASRAWSSPGSCMDQVSIILIINWNSNFHLPRSQPVIKLLIMIVHAQMLRNTATTMSWGL